MKRRLFVGSFVVFFMLGIFASMTHAGACQISEFRASATTVMVGDTITFFRKADAGSCQVSSIRQTFNGQPWGEYGGPEDSRTWNTANEFGAGSYRVCLQVREVGNDSWSGVTESCLSIEVRPSQQSPQIPSCSIEGMDPASNIVQAAYQSRTISARANCSTGVRAMRVLIERQTVLEWPQSNSISYTFEGRGPSNTLWAVCVQAAGNGDTQWAYKAERCITIQIEDAGHPVMTIVPPSTGAGDNQTSGNSSSGETVNSAENAIATSSYPQARVGQNGIHFEIFCRDAYGAQEVKDPNNALGFACSRDGRTINLDYNAVCQAIYGPGRYVHVGNMSDYTSLSCEMYYSGEYGTSFESSESDRGNGQSGSTNDDGSNSQGEASNDLCMPARLSVGSYGRIVDDGDPSSLWIQEGNAQHRVRRYYSESFTVIGGGRCLESPNYGAIRWWNVEMEDGTFGWLTEGGAGEYWLEPAQVSDTSSDTGCSMQTRLMVNSQGRSVYRGSDQMNIRQIPNASGHIIGLLPYEGRFTVLAGPLCNNGYNWWQLTYNSLTGWVAEGGNGTYWLEPITTIVEKPSIVIDIFSETQSDIAATINELQSLYQHLDRQQIVEMLYDAWEIFVPCVMTGAQLVDAVRQSIAVSQGNPYLFVSSLASSILMKVEHENVSDCGVNVFDAVIGIFEQKISPGGGSSW